MKEETQISYELMNIALDIMVEVKERRGSRLLRHDRIAALKISLRNTPQDKARKLSSNMKQSLPHLSALRAERSISKCD